MDISDEASYMEELSRAVAIREALAPLIGTEEGPDYYDGYPHCRECDAVIPQKRLDAVPGTGLCVVCADAAQSSRL